MSFLKGFQIIGKGLEKIGEGMAKIGESVVDAIIPPLPPPARPRKPSKPQPLDEVSKAIDAALQGDMDKVAEDFAKVYRDMGKVVREEHRYPIKEPKPKEFDPRLAKALNDRGLVSGDWWFLVHHKDPTVAQIEKQLKTRFYDDGTPMPKAKR